MKLFVTGMSYKTAPVELRERFAVPAASLRSVSLRLTLLGGLSEVVVLSTCNRVEIYGVAMLEDVDPATLFRLVAPSVREDLRSYAYVREGPDAMRHLLEVTGGMDSMILGENEITGQVRTAYEAARGARFTGPILNPLFQKAFQTAKEIRTETKIGHGNTSAGSVSLALARKIFGDDLSRLTVTIVGAGAMATTCARHLTKHGVASVVVCNRSLDRARELAAEFGGRAASFEDRFQEMARAQIVITTTGCTGTVVNRADMEVVMKARANDQLFLIDLAVPRDVDPDVRQLDGVFLYDMDDLEAIVKENLRDRESDLARCQEIIERRIAVLVNRAQYVEDHADADDPRIHFEPGCVFTLPARCHG